MFTEADVQTAKEYLNIFCEKPSSTIEGVLLKGPDAAAETRDLDIIIPCYNEKEYLKECLDSVVDHPFPQKVGVILVDDGSTDGSAEIADSYRDRAGVIVLHQENRGHSEARNAGIRMSRSRYLYFLDSDDYVLPDQLEKMLSFAMEKDADSVRGILFNVVGEEILRPEKETMEFREISHYDAAGYAGGTIFRSDLFREICFPADYLYEDTIMFALLSPLCRKSYEYDGSVYAYRMNPNGVTAKSQFDKRSVHSYWILELMLETIERLGIPMEEPLFDKLLGLVAQTYMRVRHLDQNVKTAVFIATCGTMKELCGRIRTEDRYRRLLSEALLKEDLTLYNQSCEIVREAMKVGR